jgi:hypothetical protein
MMVLILKNNNLKDMKIVNGDHVYKEKIILNALMLKLVHYCLVKFGWSDSLADKEYFYKIPRTISNAESEGWKRTERPSGALPELRMYCPPGRGVCPLYDTAGFVAGLQLAVSF